ncbi:MAG: DUF86 domain-containing protein, partial [Bryobacteraceae bacterium]|nr:DUF86 domain-containing protein [Bryobacteraceae bacterium]
MTKDPRVYLAHILECAEKIERFTADGRERFFQDAMVQDAVLRNFEVIGEAAKRLDDAYRAAHPEVPWRALAGLLQQLHLPGDLVQARQGAGRDAVLVPAPVGPVACGGAAYSRASSAMKVNMP